MRARVLTTLLLLALTAGQAAAAPRLLLLTEENPPFNHTDPATGRLSGAVTEILRMVFERAGVAYDMQVHPWARSYKMAQTAPDTCVFGTNRTPDREALFAWIGPLAEGGWVLFARADWPVEIKSLEDAKRHTIAVQAGNALEKHLTDLGGFTLEPVSPRVNFKMLAGGRFDLVATGLLNGQLQAKAAGVPVKVVQTLTGADISLACHPQTDGAVLARLQKSLEDLRAEGAVQAILSGMKPVM
ncbi:MAG TPA: transporter substrate-binding domain-containing protein [Azospirillaceae bacterium]|nr:transporter substrate-binding domain-containing protein [Azospirillaceae bacterium]